MVNRYAVKSPDSLVVSDVLRLHRRSDDRMPRTALGSLSV